LHVSSEKGNAAWLWLGGALAVFSCAAFAQTPGSKGWENHAGFRVRALELSSPGKPGFIVVDPKTSGVTFTNILSDQMLATDVQLLSGSGVALGDFDGDGLCDIYLCSLAGRNALYRNLGGWKFEEVAEAAGVVCPGQISRGACFADVNGDGALDLLVTAKAGGTRLFLNKGKGTFQEVTPRSGLFTNTGSTSMALADVDGNGTLDLYVANFGTEMLLHQGGKIAMRNINGRPTVVGRMARKIKVIDGKLVEFGEPDVLYLNDGQGHFTPVPWERGAFLDEAGQPVETPWDFGLTVQMRDLNGDGWPDIYVCNDFQTPDRIWINDGHGRFRAIATTAVRKSSFAAMGVDFADLTRDGHMDGLVIEMLARDPALRLRQISADPPGPPVLGGLNRRPQTGRNTLLRNRGDGTFAEIAEYAGLAASDWSWSPVFLDVDLDGYEDVLIANGSTYDLMALDEATRQVGMDPRAGGRLATQFPRSATPNCAFRNNGNLTFADRSRQWGFDSPAACTAMAVADLDGDGDLDVVVNCLNGNALLYRNESNAPRVAVRLKGLPPNTRGIGALIVVRGGAVPFQSQEMICAGRFLSGDDAVRVFAAGSKTNRLRIEISWRSGKFSVIPDALPNHLYEIDETAAVLKPVDSGTPPRPLFEDVSALLEHVHHEEPFNDFERQPLLPRRLSQLGPGVAWFDIDGDGSEELIIGSGQGGVLSAFRWDGKRFAKLPVLPVPLSGDSAGVAGLNLSGTPTVLVAQSGYEASNSVPLLRLTAGGGPGSAFQVLGAVSNLGPGAIGPIAVGDLDGDGRMEVFLGGRVNPGRYPEPAASWILRARNGVLSVDVALSEGLKSLGLVTSAVFSDLDGDGLPELIVACEWGPIRIFKFVGGKLKDLTAELGLDRDTGLWQSVTTGDLDGDGRMDIIAGNWGLNSRYRAEAQRPLVLYYGDFNDDGGVEVLETSYDLTGTRLLSAHHWQTVGAGMPFVLGQFRSNQEFSEATAEQILGTRLGKAGKLQVTTLASMVFLNRGDHFEARPLPREAQWAPVFGISVADLDGDGREDVLLAQNFFGMPSEASRQDAGRGLLLKGDGTGELRAIPGQESGVVVYGEQRGCALADYDGDGRVDAVISQNAEATRVFHNVGAAAGLRIRLRGPPGNPSAAGASLRVTRQGKVGPAREIHAGSGYWSQDSAVQVMAAAEGDQLEVRWPDGKRTSSKLPGPAREIAVLSDGSIEVLR
jgi:hypothetical protein